MPFEAKLIHSLYLLSREFVKILSKTRSHEFTLGRMINICSCLIVICLAIACGFLFIIIFFCIDRNFKLHKLLNPFHPYVRVHIPHTIFRTFAKVLSRRICLTIKNFFSWRSFSLFSDLNV